MRNNTHTQSSLISKQQIEEEGQRKTVRRLPPYSAKQLKKNPAYARLHVDQLIELNNMLSELPDGIMGSRPRRDKIGRKVFAKWREMTRRGTMRSVIFDMFNGKEQKKAIVDMLQKSSIVHGSSWLTFEWLLSFERSANHKEDLHGVPNIEKLLDGKYVKDKKLVAWVTQQRQQDELQKPADEEELTDFVFDKQAFTDSIQATEKDN